MQSSKAGTSVIFITFHHASKKSGKRAKMGEGIFSSLDDNMCSSQSKTEWWKNYRNLLSLGEILSWSAVPLRGRVFWWKCHFAAWPEVTPSLLESVVRRRKVSESSTAAFCHKKAVLLLTSWQLPFTKNLPVVNTRERIMNAEAWGHIPSYIHFNECFADDHFETWCVLPIVTNLQCNSCTQSLLVWCC